MSIRNLDHLLDPTSVAVIGASQRAGSLGATLWSKLRGSGFRGPLYPVNLRHGAFEGERVFRSVAELPAVPDLAVICTPPATVTGLVKQLAAAGNRAVVVLTGGMSTRQKAAMLAAAKPQLLRVLGPAGIGLLAPHLGLDASLAATGALPGELAFVSQSGVLASAMLDWAHARAIGFSHVVSLGEQADVDVGDLLDYLASDPKTRAILLYMEAVTSPRKFMSAARAASRNKPVIVVKAGRSRPGRHTGMVDAATLACTDAVYDAAIARAGMLRVDTLQQLFLAAETLTRFRGNGADTLTILGNGAGAGLMAADMAAHVGVALAELGDTTLQRLQALTGPGAPPGNPVTLLDDATADSHLQALQALYDDPAAGAVLLVHTPTARVSSEALAQALLPLAAHTPPRLMACWLGDTAVRQAGQAFQAAGIASYPTPEEAVRAFAMLVAYRRNQAQLMEAPMSPPGRPKGESLSAEREGTSGHPPGRPKGESLGAEYEATSMSPPPAIPTERVRALVQRVLAEGRSELNEAETGAVLEACGVAALAAPGAMSQAPTASSPTASPPLMIGARIDAVFGPVILFGPAGRSADALAQRGVALPPLNTALAQALVQASGMARWRTGPDDTQPAEHSALHTVLVTLSQLLADVPEITELDISPLFLGPGGASAQGAQVRVSAEARGGAAHFAIRPYPSGLTETVEWMGRTLTLRAIRPEDEAQHLRFLSALDPEDVRMRVFYSRRSIPRSELARLTQIDYERETAIVAVAPGADGLEETLGVARAIADPDNLDAEFGIIVASQAKRGGLGRLLMRKLIRTLREQGTQRLVATVLNENHRMLGLAKELGFVPGPPHYEEGTREIHLLLQAASAIPP